MPLEDLKERKLLLPEKYWEREPEPKTIDEFLQLAAGVFALVASLMIWFGSGGALTFWGIGLFLADLLFFLWVSFRSVDSQVRTLNREDIIDEVQGMASEKFDEVVAVEESEDGTGSGHEPPSSPNE